MSNQNANNSGLSKALEMLLETQVQLMKLIAQNQANIPNEEWNVEMNQMLGTQTQIGKMIPQLSSGNHQPQMSGSNKTLEEEIDTSLKACKACEEIGHIAKECPDEWPHCDANYPTEEYPAQVTCFLCEGNNHAPAQCHLYPMVRF